MLDTFLHKGNRERLVKELKEKGISDQRILNAIQEVPRHFFVEKAFDKLAYSDKALPISCNQTISQPLTVAIQTELLQLKGRMKILEIGTGSGYQAAVLCAMKQKVFSIEMHRRLYQDAKFRLEELDYRCKLQCGDGSLGWPLYQPYERILVTAASPGIPEPLKQQLAIGGRMVIPVGNRDVQHMTVVTRISKIEFQTERLNSFRFVPLRGKHGFEEEA